MLTTRLWMGTILIVLVAGMLTVDHHLAPVYPFLCLFQVGLAFIACLEVIELLGPGRRPQLVISVLGVLLLNAMNWLGHWFSFGQAAGSAWVSIFGCFMGLVLLVFIWEMALFQEPSQCMERMGRTLLILVYLGLLPSFLAQLRWLDGIKGNVALALAIFVPKGCDIGAYFTGRLLGRHRMTPILSPKKTWEGAIGGLITAILVTIGIDRIGTAAILRENLMLEIGFGISVGALGMLGDLAESLLKRDCRHKDASQVVPGFGGVLDVIDAVIFAAPLSYLWLKVLG